MKQICEECKDPITTIEDLCLTVDKNQRWHLLCTECVKEDDFICAHSWEYLYEIAKSYLNK